MIPAIAMTARRMRITIAVAGLIGADRMSHPRLWPTLEKPEAPNEGGLGYMKEGSVTVGRAGRLSVHTLDERALGMRGTEPPSCMHDPYRPRRVVT